MKQNNKQLFFIVFFLYLSSSVSFSDENVLFSEILIDILSEYFKIEITKNEILFENVSDTEEKWVANFNYCKTDYLIIVDNINLQVILKDAINTIILYENQRGSSLNFLAFKEWIYLYKFYHNKLERSTGADSQYRLRGLLNYLETYSLDTYEFPQGKKK